MSARLLSHFTNGTEHTRTGATIGVEVETHFADEHCRPVSASTAGRLLATPTPGPWRLTIDLGRQLLELAIEPHHSFDALHTTTLEALDWLYREAARYGAHPVFEPVLAWSGNLLWLQDDRDRIWAALDGQAALEHLCRIASVQFTFSVAPNEAVSLLNQLWAAGLHQLDYPNDAHWRRYIEQSQANYRPDRYAGPAGFEDLADYARQLARHPVVMLDGRSCHLPTTALAGRPAADIELFLRSVWWHYRLRRYGDTLTIEARPFARRTDAGISQTWQRSKDALSL